MRGLGGDDGGKEVKSVADIEQGDVVLVQNWIPEVAGGREIPTEGGPTWRRHSHMSFRRRARRRRQRLSTHHECLGSVTCQAFLL